MSTEHPTRIHLRPVHRSTPRPVVRRAAPRLRLQTHDLSEAIFAANVMAAGGDVPFEQMKLAQLKEELAARGSMRKGLKAILQRRLHSLLVQAGISEEP